MWLSLILMAIPGGRSVQVVGVVIEAEKFTAGESIGWWDWAGGTSPSSSCSVGGNERNLKVTGYCSL